MSHKRQVQYARQKKNVRMCSEPLTDIQNSVMKESMRRACSARNDFYGRFSGIQYWGCANPRNLRDMLKKSAEDPAAKFQLSVRGWTMCLFDVIGNIRGMWFNLGNALKTLVRDNKDLTSDEKKLMYYILSSPRIWGCILRCESVSGIPDRCRKLLNHVDSARLPHLRRYLRRITRREKPKIAHSDLCHTLYLDESMYSFRDEVRMIGGRETAVHLFSFTPGFGRRITVRLKGKFCYSRRGNLRVVWDGHRITIHKVIDAKCRPLKHRNSDDVKEVGIDKGYSTLISCSEGTEYGYDFGGRLNREADRRRERSHHRNYFIQQKTELCGMLAVLRDILKACTDPQLADEIRRLEKTYQRKISHLDRHNIGSEGYRLEEHRHTEVLKSEIGRSVREFIRDVQPSRVIKEDLRFAKSSSKGPRFRQKMSGWLKGVLDDRIEYICESYGIETADVNPAYTSQYCNICGEPIERTGRHHEIAVCPVCGRKNCNIMAARNILNRAADKEITLYTPYRRVKVIMEQRRSAAVPSAVADK